MATSQDACLADGIPTRHATSSARPADHAVAHLTAINATPGHGLTESASTEIRVITRMASGFRDAAALTGLGMLTPGGIRPALTGR